MFNRKRFIVSSLFTIFVLVIVTLMIVGLATGHSSAFLKIVIALPITVIAVDGGDRVLRYFIEVKRLRTQLKMRQKTGEVPTGLKPYLEVVGRDRDSDEMEEFELKPYRVVAAVYNIADEWEQILENLAPFRDKLFLIDDASPDDTYEVVKASGVEIIRNPENTNKPGAIFYGVQHLPPEVETVLVMDPDVLLPDRLSVERMLYDFQRSGAGGAAVNVLPERPKKHPRALLFQCQAIEYELAMYCGRDIPHNFVFVSGAFGIYNRQAHEAGLARSSRSVYAEDFETSIMIMEDGWRTYFDNRVLVRTDVPDSLYKFTMQRMGWYFGLIKVALASAIKIRKCKDPFLRYQFYFYNLGLTVFFHPFRVAAMLTLLMSIFGYAFGWISPAIARYQVLPIYLIVFVMLFYQFLALDAFVGSLTLDGRDFGVVLFYPLFMIYQVFIPITIGYLNYITWMLIGRKVIKDPYGPKKKQRKP